MKQQIEKALNALELDQAKRLINTYAGLHPYDMDLISYQCIYHIYSNELDTAFTYAMKGVKSFPLNGDMYYNLAYVYELRNEYLLACENYYKALYIYAYTSDEKVKTLCIDEKIANLLNSVQTHIEKTNDCSLVKSVQRYLDRYKVCFGLCDRNYRSDDNSIGQNHWITDIEKRYFGLYRVQCQEGMNINYDLIHSKSEILKTIESNCYEIRGKDEEYLLPIAVDKVNTIHKFYQNGTSYEILQREARHFNYYKVKNNTRVDSTNVSHYGMPIPLVHSKKRKKLVLNIFVDGLSQDVLNSCGLENIMPYTYQFFKKGTICTQAYSTAEWTYPSLATYVTGLTTPEHMMLHNQIDVALPTDVPTLAEYFHKVGYFTAKIDGDWRSTPNYGHARGYGQVIYQNQGIGSKQETMIGEIIDHIEAFRDTDQFLWMCMGDLHDVADGYDLTLAVQNKLDLSERMMESGAKTSVKQPYSLQKTKVYKRMIQYTDLLLNTLYTYILNNFEENEILVSLFADHGQGYLVPDNEPFLAKERTNVAFMFRGNVPEQITTELISTSDYITIMCKAAGIDMEQISISGKLPKCFGGTNERDYVLTESIHPKDPYRATIFTQNETVYFENGLPVGEDGRFALKNYKVKIKSNEGYFYDDKELCNKYLEIIVKHIEKLIIYS